MAGFLEDTFADTAGTLLESHTPTTTGGTWIKHSTYSTGGIRITAANRAAGVNTDTALYYNDADPIGADYDVIVKLTAVTETKEAGVVARCAASGTDTHYLGWYNYEAGGGAKWQLFKVVAGSVTTLAADGMVFPGTGSPKAVWMRLRTFNSEKTIAYSTDGTSYTNTAATSSDNSITAKGFAGVRLVGSNNDNADLQLSHLSAVGNTSTFTLSPSYILKGSTGNLITLTGTNTTWSVGTPGSPTFSLSGGTSASITVQTVTSSSAATLTVSAGSATGTLAITDPSSGTTANITVIDSVAVSDTHFQAGLSPYNWYYNGSSYVQTTNPGAYIKFGFTGTQLVLEVDTSILTGFSSSDYPALRVSIDNGAYTDYQLPASGKNLRIANGLSSGSHTAFIFYKTDKDSGDKWNTPVEALKITRIGLDAAATLEAASGAIAIRSRKVIIYGDSIGKGNNSLSNAVNQLTAGNAWFAYGTAVGEALNAEFGIIAYGGQGYTVAGSQNVPAVSTAWDDYYSGQSRLSGGALTPAPFAIISAHGTNDRGVGDSSVTAAVEAQIALWRAAAPSAWIFICDPPGRWKASALAAAVTNAADPMAAYVAVPASIASGLNNSGVKLTTYDGLHPNQDVHMRYAAALSEAIGEIIGESNGSGTTTAGGSYTYAA